MVDPMFDYQFRLILIGDSTVGKSCLLKYFTDGKFAETCDPTVGVDFFARLIELKPHNVRVKLQLWDTAGQERFRSITRSYYRNSVGALLLYDITKRKSFQNLSDWIEEARLHIEPHEAAFLVVGHKADMEEERQVTYKEGKNFAEKYGLKFIETSAVTGQNVEEAFHNVALEVYEMLMAGRISVEEGWDGVKNGYAPPREQFHVMDDEPPRGGCCN